MKAILTHYLPATNTRGSRIKASAEQCKSRTYGFNSLDDHPKLNPHEVAAQQFAAAMGWDELPMRLVSGGLPNGDCAHVFVAVQS